MVSIFVYINMYGRYSLAYAKRLKIEKKIVNAVIDMCSLAIARC